MPVAPRQNTKAKKIVYSILGKPANMQNSKSSVRPEVNKRLVYEETFKVK